VDIPVVAIGGIDADNIARLSGTGIAGAAVVSAIFAQEDIKKAAANLRQLIAKEL
jgi:thiamine-phosphate pyrophosphorylase/hydroxymethylpyrimidine kinase/phosphomethylpyrimidine kinase/thiamine-phosphate diphosphorylase